MLVEDALLEPFIVPWLEVVTLRGLRDVADDPTVVETFNTVLLFNGIPAAAIDLDMASSVALLRGP